MAHDGVSGSRLHRICCRPDNFLGTAHGPSGEENHTRRSGGQYRAPVQGVRRYLSVWKTPRRMSIEQRVDAKRRIVKSAPSILDADFARLGEQVAEAERAGADRIHIDVMDGHFVPNISMGASVVRSLRRVTRMALVTHMMISDPDSFLEEFVEAGSDSFLVHWEGANNLHRTVHRIKALGKGAGVVINPATPAAVLEEILPDVDQALVMTVDPGFGRQTFLH